MCAMMLASCSNDDIEIVTAGKTYDITLNVGTQGMYDEFGCTPDMREFIRKDGRSLNVTALLYDVDGNLVDVQGTTLKTFNTIPLTFKNVEEGQYTVVAVETTNIDDIKYWSINNEDKLSTLEIRQLKNEVYWYGAVGVSSAVVNLGSNGSGSVVNTTPNAVGSFFDVNFYYMNNTSFVNVGVGTKDIISAYRLDPSLSRENRFVTNNTNSSDFRSRVSIANSTDVQIGATLYFLESEVAINYYYQTESNAGSNSWTPMFNSGFNKELKDATWVYGGLMYNKSNNMCYGAVLDSEEERTDWLMGHLTELSLVPDLYLTWGGFVSAVQSFMGSYNMTMGSAGKAEASTNNSYELQYSGKGKEALISYSFSSETTGLFEADVIYSNENLTAEDALKYLSNNYTFVTSSGNIYMFSTSDGKTSVLLYPLGNTALAIGFVDTEYMNNMSSAVKKSAPQLFAERAKKMYAAHKIAK